MRKSLAQRYRESVDARKTVAGNARERMARLKFARNSAPRFFVQAKQDPTKTVTIRNAFSRAMRVRFAKLKKAIYDAIVTQNGFGLVVNRPASFNFTRTADKHGSFMDWLRQAESEFILETRFGTPQRTAANDSWMNTYIDSAYMRGVSSAGVNMRGAGADVSDRWIENAFNRPIHADAVALLYTRDFTELVGITDAMDKEISRTLAEGFARGDSPAEIAAAILEDVDNIGETRAETLARTEVISAHAEASLNSYEEAGLEGVSVDAEWATADDNAVCPLCDDMQGEIMTIEEAKGQIPLHPNCRCAWLPVVQNANQIELD